MIELIHWPIASFAADRIVEELEPLCSRIEVAGSVRRRKEFVHDVEVLCIPKPGVAVSQQSAMLEDVEVAEIDDAVMQYLQPLIDQGVWSLRMNVKGNRIGFGKKNRIMHRAWTWETTTTVEIPETVPTDIFMATDETWAALMVIRTGPREWNQYAAKRAHQLGIKLTVAGGGFLKGGELVTCETEEEYFEILRVDYVDPIQRTPEWVEGLE